MPKNNNKEFDVLIIGAGVSGLICGNLLAKQGYKTAIVEKNSHVGGCCVNIERGDFTFDAGVHFINSAGQGGPIEEIVTQFMDFNEFDFIPLKEFIHWVDLKNQIDFVVPMALDDYISTLTEFFPSENEAFKNFFSDYEKIVRFILEMGDQETGGKMISFLLKKMITMLKFLKTSKSSVKDIIEDYVKDQTARETLYYLVTSLAMFPENFTAIVYLLMEFTIRLAGAYYIRGGGGFFTKRLGEIFVQNNGTLFLNTTALSFEISKNHVKSLLIQNEKGHKDILKAKEFMVASDALQFATKLCPEGTLPKKYLNKIVDRQPANSSVTLFLGLNIDLKSYGIEDYEIWIYGRHPNIPENAERCVYQRDFSKMPLEIITIYSNIDETCCPRGKSVVTITYPSYYQAWSEFLDTNGEKLETYEQEKQRLSQYFIKVLSTSFKIENLIDHVEVAELATPLTYIRTTSNFGGSHLGWETKADSFMKDRIMQKTPLKNVRLAGQWVFPGGGITTVTMSGYAAARSIAKALKKLKKN
ncbi:MAG: phytoene desaturase family protein [Promethearchaeota archaeon]